MEITMIKGIKHKVSRLEIKQWYPNLTYFRFTLCKKSGSPRCWWIRISPPESMAVVKVVEKE